MSTATLECPTIQRARKSTRETSRAVKEWKQNPHQQFCDGLDVILIKAIDLVDAWQDVANALTDASRENRIVDYRGFGDMLYPYVLVSDEVLTLIGELVERSSELHCELEHAMNFKISVYEMGRVSVFFDNWPRTRSDIAMQIREEYARGEGRDVEEILREMQTSPDARWREAREAGCGT